MEQKRTTLFIDVLFCAVILPLVIMTIPVDRWIVRYPIFASTLIVYLYVLYYVMRKIHIPQLFMKRKYWSVACFVAVVIILVNGLTHFPFETVATHLPDPVRIYLRMCTVWLLSLVVIGFGLSIELILELFNQMLVRADIEAEKQKAELALYKAQINPHFLFNTLNSIYGLVVGKSDLAEKAFVKFSDMLQYMYKHANDDTIDIKEEISYISHYIDLQSLRLNSHTKVVWKSDIDDDNVQIPPMILITFVENAFKYGSSSSRDCEIVISVMLKEGNLCFESENSLMRKFEEDATLVGIENCRSRLSLLYPDRFTLYAAEEKGKFRVRLNIKLK